MILLTAVSMLHRQGIVIIALCSLSIGTRFTPYSLTNEIISSPATNKCFFCLQVQYSLSMFDCLDGRLQPGETRQLNWWQDRQSSRRTISSNPSRPVSTSTRIANYWTATLQLWFRLNTTTPRRVEIAQSGFGATRCWWLVVRLGNTESVWKIMKYTKDNSGQ